jgi:hypothetical protein
MENIPYLSSTTFFHKKIVSFYIFPVLRSCIILARLRAFAPAPAIAPIIP